MLYEVEYLTWSEANAIKAFEAEGDDESTLIANYVAVENPALVRVRKPQPLWESDPITDEERESAVEATWAKLRVFLNSTKDYYSPLIALYKANEANLLKSLEETINETHKDDETESSGGARGESETPTSATLAQFQTSQTDQLSFAERHIGESESRRDGTRDTKRTHDTQYLIDKLANARSKWANLFAEWYRRLYDSFIVAEAQLWG